MLHSPHHAAHLLAALLLTLHLAIKANEEHEERARDFSGKNKERKGLGYIFLVIKRRTQEKKEGNEKERNERKIVCLFFFIILVSFVLMLNLENKNANFSFLYLMFHVWLIY